MSAIDGRTVRGLADTQQQAWVDDASAERIAAGAAAAVAAVTATLTALEPGLLERDPAEFLATLEALAEVPR